MGPNPALSIGVAQIFWSVFLYGAAGGGDVRLSIWKGMCPKLDRLNFQGSTQLVEAQPKPVNSTGLRRADDGDFLRSAGAIGNDDSVFFVVTKARCNLPMMSIVWTASAVHYDELSRTGDWHR
jgi:hypothetical protein